MMVVQTSGGARPREYRHERWRSFVRGADDAMSDVCRSTPRAATLTAATAALSRSSGLLLLLLLLLAILALLGELQSMLHDVVRHRQVVDVRRRLGLAEQGIELVGGCCTAVKIE